MTYFRKDKNSGQDSTLINEVFGGTLNFDVEKSSWHSWSRLPDHKIIVDETLEFVKRELTSQDGGFFSSLDADSEGEEGKFYVWTFNEIQKALGDKADLIIDYYNLTEQGNWEKGKNILISLSDSLISISVNSEESTVV